MIRVPYSDANGHACSAFARKRLSPTEFIFSFFFSPFHLLVVRLLKRGDIFCSISLSGSSLMILITQSLNCLDREIFSNSLAAVQLPCNESKLCKIEMMIQHIMSVSFWDRYRICIVLGAFLLSTAMTAFSNDSIVCGYQWVAYTNSFCSVLVVRFNIFLNCSCSH